MKLSSAPTRWAFTSVIAAAMKHGPTRISKIAFDLDIPIETCRYYIRKYHEQGFKFLPVVNYRALGLSPSVAFIRLKKSLKKETRENLLRWLDTVYTVYRAPLSNEDAFYMETVPPVSQEKHYHHLLTSLEDAGLIENFEFYGGVEGFYQPRWVRMYDFTKNEWSNQPEEVEIPKIPLNTGQQQLNFDNTDLLILSELEKDPLVKMNRISTVYRISPQLISYHREKHIDGACLITGYIPVRRTKYTDMKVLIKHGTGREDIAHDYLHSLIEFTKGCKLRLHVPTTYVEETLTNEIVSIGVRRYTIPSEYYVTNGKWTGLETFIEQLNVLLRVIT